MFPIQLFGPLSVAPDSVVFEVPFQVTVLGLGLPEGDFITFEFVKVSGDQRQKVCGCRLSPQIFASIEGVQELQCPSCEELTQRPVRLTPQNPVVVLDVPQNTMLRAIYNGDGLETQAVRVWVVDSNTQDLTDSLRGCPPIYYPDDEQTWTDTGLFRCLPDQITVEYEQTNECGRRRWFPDPARPQRWEDTCCIRCLADGTTVEVQQVNQCGDLRWTESETVTQVWTDTGNIRCLADEVTVEAEQTNQCGDRRWVLSTDVQIWLPAGVHRCTQEGTVELQEANQCGQLRWVECGAVVWIDTGLRRCLEDEITVEVEQTNQCGHRRWEIADYEQVWTDTTNIRCLEDGVTVEVQQVNQCGDHRWADAGYAQVWTDTANVRCLEDGITVEIEQANQCGGRRWADAGYAQVWTDTANIRCLEDEVTIEVEQTNQCGARRWATESFDQNWVETGTTRCADGLLEVQQVNQCGLLRWVETGDACVVTPPSVHSIVSIVPVEDPITEGAGACWQVTLNAPVLGADLTIDFSLSGAEQDVHGYPAPDLVIAIGNVSGIVCVPTTDDAMDELTLPLCIDAILSSRIIAAPATSCLDVEDNDEAGPGDSTHTVIDLTVLPTSAAEGTEFCWTVTLSSPVAGSDLTVYGVLSGAEQGVHSYPNPSVVIPVGMSSGDLCVTTTNDAFPEATLPLCLAVQLSPRITSGPAAVCADVTDDGDEAEPATLPGFIGGECFVDNPNTSLSEFYVTFMTSGDFYAKTPIGFDTHQWMPTGMSAADYEVRIDDTTSPPMVISGSARNTWLPMTAHRDFRWGILGPGASSAYVAATVRVRRIGEVVDDATITIDPSTFVSTNVDCP